MSVSRKLRRSVSISQLRIESALLLLALFVGTAGYWGPWISHRTVALVLIGQDMGEFVKFLPQVRDGTVFAVRQLFYLPPFCACLILALMAASTTLRYGRLLRAVFLLAILPLSLALLPPVVSVPVLKSPEFRLQVIGLVFCWALLPGSWLLRRVPAPAQMGVIAALGLVSATLPLWQFLAVLPATEAIYGQPLHVGWGLVASTVGFLGIAFLGLLLTFQMRLGGTRH